MLHYKTRPAGRILRPVWLALTTLMLISGGAHAARKDASIFDLAFEEILDIHIMTASKKPEDLFTSPASATVLTAEDIRRSGATSIPEVLRMVPGVEVARINTGSWAVSIRGFNNEHANKLLVMIDGRSTYNPLFAGTRWDVHDVMLEDVDRIEVIRGPGGTLWGSNAVNGIINIITKNSRDTQGVLATGGVGSHEQEFGALRYGGTVGRSAHYRVYAKYFNRDDTPSKTFSDDADDHDHLQGGFRLDWRIDDANSLTLQGDVFSGHVGRNGWKISRRTLAFQDFTEHFATRGGNLLGRWSRSFSETSDMTLQIYYSREVHKERLLKETINTTDIDFQHRFRPFKSHEIVWGLNYRYSNDHTDGTLVLFLDPEDRDLQLYSGFIQDTITLVPERLSVILGIKAEHNKYTDMEYQPNIRIAWTPNTENTLWASVSRAVRIPSRVERNGINNIAAWPFMLSKNKNDIKSERVVAYECGYRFRPAPNFLLDLSLFYNRYSNYRSQTNIPAFFVAEPVPHIELAKFYDNDMDGETYGLDISATWDVSSDWRLFAGYSFIDIHMHNATSSQHNQREGRSPENQVYLRSYLNLPGNVELDIILKYTDNLTHVKIHSYTRLDVRLGWHISRQWELSIVGQNLIDSGHVEYVNRAGSRSNEIERRLYTKLIWRY